MTRSFAIASMGQRFVHRILPGEGNPGMFPSGRALSGANYDDYRKILRTGLGDINLEDSIMLFGKMVESRPYPFILEFNKLNKRVSEAVDLVDRMVLKGCPLDLVTYGVVVNGICKTGNTDLTLNILNKMELGELKPGVVIYNTVIDSLCKYKHVNDALDLFKEMENKGIRSNVVTYTTLISCLYSYGRWNDSSRLRNDMIEKQINPDVVIFNALINGFVKEGKLLEAGKLLEEMVKSF